MATVADGTQWNKSHKGQNVIGIAGDGIPANTTPATGTEVKTYFREDTIQGKKLGRGSLPSQRVQGNSRNPLGESVSISIRTAGGGRAGG